MAIELDHVIVPSQTPLESAKFLATLLDVPCEDTGHFKAVYVNEGLTFDFAKREQPFGRQHYCFRVCESVFDQIFDRVLQAKVIYRSTPNGPDDMKVNPRLGGRNFYWNDNDGHCWEVLTVSYARQVK